MQLRCLSLARRLVCLVPVALCLAASAQLPPGVTDSQKPGEVPLPSTGALESSVAMAGAWNLTYTGVDETTLDSVVGALESAGFAQTYEMTAGDYAQSTWDNGTWTVSLIWDLSSDGALNVSVVATP